LGNLKKADAQGCDPVFFDVQTRRKSAKSPKASAPKSVATTICDSQSADFDELENSAQRRAVFATHKRGSIFTVAEKAVNVGYG
jgi:hypothetical protein